MWSPFQQEWANPIAPGIQIIKFLKYEESTPRFDIIEILSKNFITYLNISG